MGVVSNETRDAILQLTELVKDLHENGEATPEQKVALLQMLEEIKQERNVLDEAHTNFDAVLAKSAAMLQGWLDAAG